MIKVLQINDLKEENSKVPLPPGVINTAYSSSTPVATTFTAKVDYCYSFFWFFCFFKQEKVEYFLESMSTWRNRSTGKEAPYSIQQALEDARALYNFEKRLIKND